MAGSSLWIGITIDTMAIGFSISGKHEWIFPKNFIPRGMRLWYESRIMNFRKLLGRAEAGTKAWTETDSVRKIVESLDHMDPAKAGFVAAFAYMLGRVAYADQEISDQEVH